MPDCDEPSTCLALFGSSRLTAIFDFGLHLNPKWVRNCQIHNINGMISNILDFSLSSSIRIISPAEEQGERYVREVTLCIHRGAHGFPLDLQSLWLVESTYEPTSKTCERWPLLYRVRILSNAAHVLIITYAAPQQA